MRIFLHILKRLVLVLIAYFLSVLFGLIAVVVFYSMLSSLPNAPDYFSAMEFSPVVVLVVPAVGLFVYWIALILTVVQTLLVAIVSEFFELRNIFVHALFGMVVAASGFILASPTVIDGIEGSDWADIGIIAASGVVAGLFYWLIAGRDAGIRPPARALAAI
jgi:hypothetical protein